MNFPPTVILRHHRENLAKCSLRGLERREDMQFYSYPCDPFPSVEGYLLLEMEAPPLTEEDASFGILLLDATWRYAERMRRSVSGSSFIPRRLPDQFRTAYPRRQVDCPDPERGLASIEALFVAYHILGRSTSGLLDHYYWKDLFLEKNKRFLD